LCGVHDDWPGNSFYPSGIRVQRQSKSKLTSGASDYFPMQKVKTGPDPSVYAGFSKLAFSWRLAGDLNFAGNLMNTSAEST
jgi:hypothetical protein